MENLLGARVRPKFRDPNSISILASGYLVHPDADGKKVSKEKGKVRSK